MDNIIYYNNLFDYYGELLTSTQINYFKAYYYDNLSLSEISEEYNVSRNAISKTLKDVKEKLDYYEAKLHLYENKEKIISKLDDKCIKLIENYI